MSAILSSPPAADLALPSHVWRGAEQAAQEEFVLPTGLPPLDAVLPGGGWPVGQLVEVLQTRPQQHVWRLLVPALARAVQAGRGPVVLVGPPHPVFAPSLAAQGLAPERLLWVKAVPPAARLWAAEQALRCAESVAVLAWLPQVQSAELRRLHLAAQQHRRLLFAFRPESARAQSSPARLRLLLESGEALKVHVLKRRGPPLVSPVLLPPWQALLADWLRARARGEAAVGEVPSLAVAPPPRARARRPLSHAALDRTPTSAG
ncbi:translesion DNA synthesis-associated protein ImuA [Ramlibacter rhizophilus]|uniref:translesion DNA synthesis-associated protein ImuA n=1 Tax=Ramlibacter rhizophilus TaxID=1781167 RepID=UPI001F0F107B|nr:translesion DNA synthesis-associated protein ImuA [Ramlibacter rhizophilus]